ncbi:Uncharacterised protein [Mycobacteroides abscessus subsp. abscessus]|nr:Uncharacterised protein [Mycobacteroides abscessus subsp. abscessus]
MVSCRISPAQADLGCHNVPIGSPTAATTATLTRPRARLAKGSLGIDSSNSPPARSHLGMTV